MAYCILFLLFKWIPFLYHCQYINFNFVKNSLFWTEFCAHLVTPRKHMLLAVWCLTEVTPRKHMLLAVWCFTQDMFQTVYLFRYLTKGGGQQPQTLGGVQFLWACTLELLNVSFISVLQNIYNCKRIIFKWNTIHDNQGNTAWESGRM